MGKERRESPAKREKRGLERVGSGREGRRKEDDSATEGTEKSCFRKRRGIATGAIDTRIMRPRQPAVEEAVMCCLRPCRAAGARYGYIDPGRCTRVPDWPQYRKRTCGRCAGRRKEDGILPWMELCHVWDYYPDYSDMRHKAYRRAETLSSEGKSPLPHLLNAPRSSCARCPSPRPGELPCLPFPGRRSP